MLSVGSRTRTTVGNQTGNGSAVAGAKPVPDTAEAAVGLYACGVTCMLAAPGVKSNHKHAANKTTELQVVRKRQPPAPHGSLQE